MNSADEFILCMSRLCSRRKDALLQGLAQLNTMPGIKRTVAAVSQGYLTE